MRTTSTLEAFNLSLNRSIHKNPHFFKFVEGIRLHESHRADHMYNLVHGNVPSTQYDRKHHKDQEREEKIKKNTELISSGRISINEFLKQMAVDDNGEYSTNN